MRIEEGFKEYLKEEYHDEDINYDHWIFRFENGFGASVINDNFFGKKKRYELAVLEWAVGASGQTYDELCYETKITDDVVTGLTVKGVHVILEEIKNFSDIKSGDPDIFHFKSDEERKEFWNKVFEEDIKEAQNESY